MDETGEHEDIPEDPKEVETVRCMVLNNKNEVLLLQKSANSNAPLLYEFPGGRIHPLGQVSTAEEQVQTVLKELREEAGEDLSSQHVLPVKVDEFSYEFDHRGKPAKRKVHMYHVELLTDGSEVVVDTTKNSRGESEDKHTGFIWVAPERLVEMRDEGKLSGNSTHF